MGRAMGSAMGSAMGRAMYGTTPVASWEQDEMGREKKGTISPGDGAWGS